MSRSLLSAASPRARVIVDNDFSGDPDDLFQLVHHLLSPSVEVVLVVGSHLPVHDHLDPSAVQADNASRIARTWIDLLGRQTPVLAGSNAALEAADIPSWTPAVDAIIAEAHKEATTPLYYCAGAGLTDLASALLLDPSIAHLMTLVWIGGEDYPQLTATPYEHSGLEFNLSIDLVAATVVFNDYDIPLWQVPRSTYRQILASFAELDAQLGGGRVGDLLLESLAIVVDRLNGVGYPMGEAYPLGDQALVLLTALQSSYSPEPSSSRYSQISRPRLLLDGSYAPGDGASSIFVFTSLDTRTMLDDFYAKVRRVDRARA